MTKKERPHADVIRQWLDNPEAEFEWRMPGRDWEKLRDDGCFFMPHCEYRIRPAPKKKVEMWQYAFRHSSGRWFCASCFYKNDADAKRALDAIDVQQLGWTRIEVEED